MELTTKELPLELHNDDPAAFWQGEVLLNPLNSDENDLGHHFPAPSLGRVPGFFAVQLR
jgi:hypothetical protein